MLEGPAPIRILLFAVQAQLLMAAKRAVPGERPRGVMFQYQVADRICIQLHPRLVLTVFQSPIYGSIHKTYGYETLLGVIAWKT